MKNRPLVSVIIPTYKRLNKLICCLDSIFDSNYKNIEVIVVNDDPNSDISEYFKKYKIKLIQNKKNLFASYSKNYGAKNAKGELLFFLDDDNILNKDTIKNLIKNYDYKIGLLGPIMYNENKEVWFSGAKANWITLNPKKLKNKRNKKFIETDVVPNAAIISKYLFENVGGYDELFPIHGEDFDLPQKLLKKGYKSFICNDSSVVHSYGLLNEHLTPKRLYFVVRSSILLERKYAPKIRLPLFFIYLFFHMLYYFIIYIPGSKNRVKYYKNYLMGLKDGLILKIK